MIALEGIAVRKSGVVLLDGIDLCLEKKELVGVIGPNGAGKTTLLNVIAGFESFEGTLHLFGSRISQRRPRRMRRRIAYVPQSLSLDPTFPILAREAVLTGASGRLGLFRLPGRAERAEALRLMETMRIAHLADRPLGQLSGGERQKVSLARAILQQPEILLLDEPTANLDMAVQKEVLDLIDTIHDSTALTILFVTHDFNLLPASMGRVVLLREGRKVFDGVTGTGLSGGSLSRLFDYPLETFQHGGRRFVSYG